MTRKKATRNKICAYCGQYGETTRDHVVPRGLFTTLPEQNITVPACKACNNRKSVTDAYIRDMLAFHVDASAHEVAQQRFREKVVSSMTKQKSKVGWAVATQGVRVPRFTHSGIYADDVFIVPVDEALITEGLSWIVRGLYFHMWGEAVLQGETFEVREIRDIQAVARYFPFDEADGPHYLGDDGVFAWMVARALEESSTWWILQFYGRVYYSVVSSRFLKAASV